MGVVLELDDDLGAAADAGTGGDGEAAGAVRYPLMALVVHPEGTGLDGDPVCNHKGGVETDPELADEIDVLLGRLLEIGEEGFGARVGDGAQVRFQLAAVHTDAGVDDGERFLIVINLDLDLQRQMAVKGFFLGEALVAILFQGVGGVGDQLTEKDLTLGVKRVDDDIKQLLDFGLKLLGFGLRLGGFTTHGHDSSKIIDDG